MYPFIDPITLDKIKMVKGSPKDINSQLSVDIDSNVLESSMGGEDERVFQSELYLDSPFEVDYFA